MNIERKRTFIINILYYVLVIAIAFFCLKYLANWLMPFIIGFAIAFMLKPVIDFITKKFKIKRKASAFFVVMFSYSTLGVGLWFLGVKLVKEIGKIFANLPQIYTSSIQPVLEQINTSLIAFFNDLGPDIAENVTYILETLVSGLGDFVKTLSSKTVDVITASASSVPAFLIAFLFAIISSIMISMDYNKVTGFIIRQFSPKIQGIIFDIKDYLVHTIFKYIKAYSMIMSITFIELAIGLSILKIDSAIGIAALIAIADILPLLGTGGIVIPWIIIELFKGNFQLGIGLLIVYLIITIIRNIIEPRIVGHQLGLYPLVTFMAMYVGLKLFGFFGMLFMPIAIMMLKNLNDSGKIKLWK